jgi:hypothetical protein
MFELVDQVLQSKPCGKNAFAGVLGASQTRQAQLHKAMALLAAQSVLPGSSLILQVHKKKTGNWWLRWRVKVGSTYRYVTWDDAQANLAFMNPPMQAHYRRAQALAKEMNALDSMLLHTITFCSRVYGLDRAGTKVSIS